MPLLFIATSHYCPVHLAARWLMVVALLLLPTVGWSEDPPDFEIDLTTASEGFDGEMFWVLPRAGAIPPGEPGNDGPNPLVVMIMQRASRTGSDVYFDIYSLESNDFGKTWTTPNPQPALTRFPYDANLHSQKQLPNSFTTLMQPGDEITVCDIVPKWHAASKTLLAIGQTCCYRNNRIFQPRPRATAYTTYYPKTHSWNDWKILQLPERKELGNFGSGAAQRVDLENGEILLPIFHRIPQALQNVSTVLRCAFDGETLTCLEEGTPLTVNANRGVMEPSLTLYRGRFYLTLRNNDHGYVTTAGDGLRFEEPRRWTFDDGSDLGNYNTQQHWVTHRDGLFLIYTRKGANNDHVMRHRAPMFIARVDPEKLQVIRETERILMPNRGARMGNFGVLDLTPDETWVTESEWMQPHGVEKYGSNNSIWVAKLKWNRPAR